MKLIVSSIKNCVLSTKSCRTVQRARFSFLHLWACLALLGCTDELSAQTIPGGFNDAVVLAGWTEPVGVAFDANDRAYVWEKRGMVWIIENGVRLPDPLVDIRAEVGNWRDHGCLGFALDPAFLSNGRIYLMYAVDRHHLMNHGTGSYNAATDQYYAASIMRITRYTAAGPSFNQVDITTRMVLLGETRRTGVPLLHESHSTGQLVFGTDGTLLATVGDGASYNNVDVGNDAGTYYAQALTDSIIRPAENVGAMRSQLLNCHNGKLLRLDPNTGNGVPSNPYYNASAPRSPQSRVWALGLRNPYRMTLRPGTGSTDPAAADPGSFYIGDVGWASWEDLNVCDEGSMNFGWPLFEGMEANAGYTSSTCYNSDAPNPLFGLSGCTQAFLQFKDLLKQDTPIHLNGHPNPCNAGVQVPVNIPKHFHARPAIDWSHGTRSRCAGFSGSMAITYDLGAGNSPVVGPAFGGSASVGGTWLTGTGWPVGYQNVYINADYAGSWIRKFAFDANDAPVSVSNFGTNMGAVVFLTEGPDGAIWYIRYDTNQLRKIAPVGVTNLAPVATILQNAQYGPGPLSVQFIGSTSIDPESSALTYAWNFGNGQTSGIADPSMSFTAPANTPTTYTVTLTVMDPQGLTNVTTSIVSVNNTPPVPNIISFPDGHFYPLGIDTIYALEATVADMEHSGGQLTYAWMTVFHHNSHTHPESVNSTPISSTVISGVGCGDEDFSYEVRLKVTDAGGLSSSVTHWLYPRCYAIAPTAVISSDVMAGPGPLSVNFNGTMSSDPGTVTGYAWDFGDGTTSSSTSPSKVFTDTGDHYVTLTVTDNDGLTGTATRVISVITLDAPQCVGAAGSLLRQFWSGVAGGTVADLLLSPNYPHSPTGTTNPTSFQAPANFGNDYGTRMRGYIVAPTTGNYVFTAVSDDASLVYLSWNADPRFKQEICSVPGWTNTGEFTKYSSQTSSTIALQAGKFYYVEMLHKEGSGGDHLALFWQTPTNSTRTIIPSSALVRWQDCVPSVTLRANLQGPFSTQNNLMRDDLRALVLVPGTEPFTGLGFTHAGGGGGETVSGATLAVTGPNAVVDWVLVELRNKNNAAQIIATRSALLQRDGDIVGINGYQRLLFNVAADNYFVAVRHRNHLSVMTATGQALSKDEKAIDLTQTGTTTYGTNARVQVANGRWALWSGNAVRDTQLKYTGTNNDRDAVLLQIGGAAPTNTFNGYVLPDLNLDGVTKYTGPANDRDLILLNIGGSVPTNARTEQMP